MIYDCNFFDWKQYDSNNRYISKEFNTKTLKRRANLPITPGCYIWKMDNCIIYVGRTNNIRNRLGDHIFGKISSFKKNAIYNTTARDTVAKFLLNNYNHEQHINLTVEEKKNNPDYMKIWNQLQEIINQSTFIIYSCKTSCDSESLERELIKKHLPKANNVMPKSGIIRDDKLVFGKESQTFNF